MLRGLKHSSRVPLGIEPLSYRAEIDGLRAIAVLLVLGFHAFPTLIPGGYIGVDIFFVISGYLITSIIISAATRGTFSIVDFYIARVRRILPALITVLAASLAFGFSALFPDEFKQLSLHVIGAATFLSNFLLWREAGYFDASAATKPLLHLWSLGIEEQFYLLWPFIILTCIKLGVRPVRALVLILLTSFVANIALIDNFQTATFYSPFTRAWELLAGAFVALSPKLRKTRLLDNFYSAIGALALAVSVCMLDETTPFPGWLATIPVAGTALLILGGGESAIGRLLGLKPLIMIGQISYPLYLWHWPLFSFTAIVNRGPPDISTTLILLAVSLFLATVTHVLVELPAQRTIRARPHLSIVPGVILCPLAGISSIFYLTDGLKNRTSEEPRDAIAAQLGGSFWTYNENDLCRDIYGSAPHLFCIKSSIGDPTLMLVGNSYANHLYPGALSAFPHETILNVGTCDPSAKDNDKSDCTLQDSIVANSATIKTIILASDWRGHYSVRDAAELRRRVKWMAGLGKKIYIFGPKLDLPFHIRECFRRPYQFNTKNCTVTRDSEITRKTAINAMLKSAAQGIEGAEYFDQLPLFCETQNCTPIRDGLPLLRDEGHYSVFGSTLLMNSFAASIDRHHSEN